MCVCAKCVLCLCLCDVFVYAHICIRELFRATTIKRARVETTAAACIVRRARRIHTNTQLHHRAMYVCVCV